MMATDAAPAAPTRTVLTIGHSNHSLEDFLRLLRDRAVSRIADVRSAPYSRFNPQFNREALAASLAAVGIGYVFLGGELGGRSSDPGCYQDGRIRYDRLARTRRFGEGLERVSNCVADGAIALMCAEREPLHCHRTLLVAPALARRGITVAHIHADGRLEGHDEAMERLLRLHDLQTEDLFAQSPDALVELAIRRQAERVGHVLAAGA